MNFRSAGHVPKTKANHESAKFGKHEKRLGLYMTPSSFVLSSPAKLKAGKLRVFVIRGFFCLLL
jgi:hypothetical protein